MDIKLIALDVDGTLLNSSMEILPSTVEALTRAHKAGIHIALSTGRIVSECADILANLPCIRYVNSCTGAEVVDLQTGRSLGGARITAPEANRLYGLLKDLKVFLDVFDPKDQAPHCRGDLHAQLDTIFASSPAVGKHIERFYKPEADLDAYVRELNHDIIKFFMIFLSPADKQEALRRLAGESYTIAEASVHDLEIMPVGVNKATGLEILSKALGLTREQVMVLGDGGNDVDQLRFAGLPVVMGNGSPAAKACARFITADNDHDGVAKAVNMVLDGTMEACVEW